MVILGEQQCVYGRVKALINKVMAREFSDQVHNSLAITLLLLRNLCPRIVCPAGGNVSSLYKVLRYAPQSSFTELVSGV
jgi:hypothetical protein